jgi:hypothetical protein
MPSPKSLASLSSPLWCSLRLLMRSAERVSSGTELRIVSNSQSPEVLK